MPELNLRYPVLTICPRYIMGRTLTEKELLVVGEVNLKKGCFDGCILIDAEGRRFKILSASIRKKIFGLWSAIFPEYRTVWVDLELSEPERVSLEDVKKEVLGHLIPKKWYRSSDDTAETITAYVEQALSIEELINKIVLFP